MASASLADKKWPVEFLDDSHPALQVAYMLLVVKTNNLFADVSVTHIL